MGDELLHFGLDEMARLGLSDPTAPDAADRLSLIRYVIARGATIEQIAAAPNLGELALDLNLRPGPHNTLVEVIAELGIEWEQAERLLTALGFPLDRYTLDFGSGLPPSRRYTRAKVIDMIFFVEGGGLDAR